MYDKWLSHLFKFICSLNLHTLRLSGSVVPSSRKLKMLTQTSKHFSNSCISRIKSSPWYSSYGGHSCWSSWFCRYCHQASYKLLVLVSKFDKCPLCSAKQRKIPKLSSYHLPLLLLTSARRFLFCVMNSGTWTLQGNKCSRLVITELLSLQKYNIKKTKW